MTPVINFDLLSKFGTVYFVGGVVRKMIDIRSPSFDFNLKNDIIDGLELFGVKTKDEVRDKLKSLITKDIDMCVTISLEEVVKILEDHEIKHRFDNFEVEDKRIVYFKYDGYSYDVTSINNVYNDLKRDVTYNTVFYDLFNNVLIDPYRGIYDYCHNIVKHVMDFVSCPKHILRMLRFVAEYDHKLCEESENHLKENLKELGKVRKEYVSEKLVYMSQKGILHKYLKVLDQYSVLNFLFPNIIMCTDNFIDFISIECNLAYLFRYASYTELHDVTERLVINKIMERVKFLIFSIEQFDVNNLFKILGKKKHCAIQNVVLCDYIDKVGLDQSIKNLCDFVFDRSKELFASLIGTPEEKLQQIEQMNINRFRLLSQ